MRRRLEPLLPIALLLGCVAAALVVNLLLTSAEERGLEALEESLGAEVRAIAAGQDQRLVNTASAASGITSPDEPLAMQIDDPGDQAKLQELVDLFGPDFRTGLYLVDLSGRITQGAKLLDRGVIGSEFSWAGYEEIVGQPLGVLPIARGLTSDEPTIALVLPVADLRTPDAPVLLGSLIFESAVAPDSDFNREVAALQRGETGGYYFLDPAGLVIASNDPSALARPLENDGLRSLPVGLHRVDDEVVVVDEVPTASWTVVFRQDAEEFEEPLAGPLQSTGRILVFALLAGGLVLMALLYRRLKASRAEQARLAALSAAQQEFISIVSHELRTPVAGVLGFLETCLDHWDVMDDEDRKQAISRAASNARRLQAMTRDVLDTDSIEAGRLVHVFDRLDLGAEVQIAVDGIREADPDRDITFEPPEQPVWVEGDADRLQQVLTNLLENAAKSSPALEPIVLKMERQGSQVEVAVVDHGPGIAAESLERIFEKFVRGSRETVAGTGLGLYISRQIIDAHGGRIWADSTPGEGATFRFSLPTAADLPDGSLPEQKLS